MEAFGGGAQPLALVDYAHTPDALAKVLEAARAHARGRLLCVFGCGGDRDPGKRPLMGAIAESRADVVIVTDDNPRTEDSRDDHRADPRRHAPPASGAGDRRPRRGHPPRARRGGCRRRRRDRRQGPRGLPDLRHASVRPFSDREIVRRALGEPAHETRPRQLARADRRRLAGRRRALRRRLDRHARDAARRAVRRARAASASTATISSPRPRRAARRRPRQPAVDAPLPQVVVADTLAGLSAFAQCLARSSRGIVVGITGSNGKTTVKEMTRRDPGASALASSRRAI